MPSKRAARLKRKKQKRYKLPEAKTPLVPDEFAAERRGMEIFLRQTTGFRLALALYNDPLARDEVVRSLREELTGQSVRLLTLDLHEPSSERTLLARVKATVEKATLSPDERLAVMVINLEAQVVYTPELVHPDGIGTDFLETANLHRELFPDVCPDPLVLWMTEPLERALVKHAPDLWHWRSHVFDLRTRLISHEKFSSKHRSSWSNADRRRHPEDRLVRLEEELAAYRKLNSLFDEGRILNAIGVARLDMGDARNALRDFKLALEVVQKLNNLYPLRATLGNLGSAYTALGKFSEAIRFHEQGLAISRQLGDRSGESIDLGNLAVIYAELGELPKAIELHQRELIICREVGDRRGEGESLWNLAVAHKKKGDYHEAVRHGEQALTIMKSLEYPNIHHIRSSLEDWSRSAK